MNKTHNEKRKLIILLPKILRTGPILGAFAIANTLVDEFSITIVSIKGGVEDQIEIKEGIFLEDLSRYKDWLKRIKRFNSLMENCDDRDVVLSMCFSADLFNAIFVNKQRKISSIRANNLQNYTHTYGKIFGYLIDRAHKIIFRSFDNVIVISKTMQKQVMNDDKRIPISLIENFIDEESIEKYRHKFDDQESIDLIFVGSLTTRKQPLLLIDGLQKILNKGIDARLSIIGVGPLISELERKVSNLSISESVKFYGHIDNPYQVIAKGDIFIMPSLSEGISRASLEALFLGLPCLLRNIDGNAELVNQSNGVLFMNEKDYEESLMDVIDLYRSLSGAKASLLPENFSQSSAKAKLLKLLNP